MKRPASMTHYQSMAIRSRDDPASLRATTCPTTLRSGLNICVLVSQELHRVLTQQGVNNMLQPGRHFLGLSTLWVLGMLLLPRLSSAQVVSQDPNFTPSVLKSGLSGPSGLVFRSPTGDLVVPQNGANQISLVNASSGGTKSFAAQTYPQDVAVRANDGLVAV